MSNLPPEQQIDRFWEMLENCWEIEPREYFEKEAPENGFGSPLAMAVHYMWKREPKVAQALADEREACAVIADNHMSEPCFGKCHTYIAKQIRARSDGRSARL